MISSNTAARMSLFGQDEVIYARPKGNPDALRQARPATGFGAWRARAVRVHSRWKIRAELGWSI